MLLLTRARYPRIDNVVGFIMSLRMLVVGIACRASMSVLMLGGSSALLSVARFCGGRNQRLSRGTAATR